MGVANYDYIKEEILSEYGGLSNEETRSGQICPACAGGPSKEGSLSITRRGNHLLYVCHRATCGTRGVVGIYGQVREDDSRNKRVRKRAHIPVSRLDSAIVKFLSAKHGVPESSIILAELGWTGEGTSSYARRFSFPIFGPNSRKRGTSYRSYEGKEPKAIVRLDDDEALSLCWYKWKRTSDVLILVEDQMSAIKIAPHHHAAALLGTNLSEAKVHEILLEDKPYKRIYLCLDNDATYEAIKQQLRLSNRLTTMTVKPLEKDIKNMNPEEFKIFLEGIS